MENGQNGEYQTGFLLFASRGKWNLYESIFFFCSSNQMKKEEQILYKKRK